MSEDNNEHFEDEDELKEALEGLSKEDLADVWAKLEVATIMLNQGRELMRQVGEELAFRKIMAKEFPKE